MIALKKSLLVNAKARRIVFVYCFQMIFKNIEFTERTSTKLTCRFANRYHFIVMCAGDVMLSLLMSGLCTRILESLITKLARIKNAEMFLKKKINMNV